MDRPRAVLVLVGALLAAGACGCAEDGRRLFGELGCVNCHRFGKLGGGGAPDLTDVGTRRDAAWIRRQIVDPRSNDRRSRMPAFPRVRGYDLRSLVAFLRRG